MESAFSDIKHPEEQLDQLAQKNFGWRKLLRLSSWFIGAAALYIFLHHYFDLDVFKKSISQSSGYFLLGAVCSYFLGGVLRAVRWTFIVRIYQPLSWTQGYHILMIANAVNFFFPVRVGEILKLIIVKKRFGVSYRSSTAASIIEKLTFFLIIIVFLGMAPWAGFHFNGWSEKFLPFVGLLLFVSAIFLFFGSGVTDWLKKCAESFLMRGGERRRQLQILLSNKFLHYFEDIMRQCHYSTYSCRQLGWIGVLGLLALIFDGITNYCLLSAFGLEVTYLQAVIAGCFFNVLFLLPSPPVQIGTAEVFPVLIYSVGLGLAVSVVASLAFAWHMLSMAIVALLGLISLHAVGFKVDTVVKMACQRKTTVNKIP